MIVGIGIDIVETSRIEKMIGDHSQRFLHRIFTKEEQISGQKRKNASQFFAGRWAVKEAFAKALGSGIGEECQWLEIEVLNDQNGKPEVALIGKTKAHIKKRKITSIQVSISHEKRYACSVVLLEHI